MRGALHPISAARAAALRPRLDALDASLDRAARLAADPVVLPRRYGSPADLPLRAGLSASVTVKVR